VVELIIQLDAGCCLTFLQLYQLSFYTTLIYFSGVHLSLDLFVVLQNFDWKLAFLCWIKIWLQIYFDNSQFSLLDSLILQQPQVYFILPVDTKFNAEIVASFSRDVFIREASRCETVFFLWILGLAVEPEEIVSLGVESADNFC